MSKKKNTLLRNTSILMAATIISRVIGLLYRSPLGETIGNEGLGYYSTASNLYTILLLISSYSIPMAVSKIVSERLALKEYRNAHRVFHGALLYAVIVGGVAALVAFFGGKFLLPYNQQNALLALRVLAPTIFFSAVLGVLRGYFQAHSTMIPTSISQIIEQVFNAAFSIGAAWFFIQQFATNDTEHAKFGAPAANPRNRSRCPGRPLLHVDCLWRKSENHSAESGKGHAPPRRILPRNFSGSFSDGNTGYLYDLYL